MDTVHLLWEGGITMIRRFPWRRLALSALCWISLGCEPHHSWLRHHDDEALSGRVGDVKAVDSDATKVLGVDSDGKDAKPFFSGDRRSGGLSSEARAVERDLGVN
jgi:hypothetical protein